MKTDNRIFNRVCLTMLLILTVLMSAGQNPRAVSQCRIADQGDGTCTNPVLYADYSDPECIRTGEDYYLTASSFNCIPGLPVLHSRDLVNWELIGHAVDKLPPVDYYNQVRHGGGIWAPSIHFHDNRFWIFYPDPDYGIYMVRASDARGPWSDPVLVQPGKGLTDPSPLWDDNGKAYLVYALAGSRAGMKSILLVSPMKPDGTGLYALRDGFVNDTGTADIDWFRIEK